MITDCFVSLNLIGGQLVILHQTFTLCHLNFGGEQGDIEISEALFYKIILGFLVLIVHIFTVNMAEAASRAYNLRSREEVVELPVHL